MKSKILGATLLLLLSASNVFSQSSLKVIVHPTGIITTSSLGITSGLGYEWQRGRHLLNADLAASFLHGLYLGCGQGAASLNFRTAYNYRLFGSSFRMYWNLGTGASMYYDSNSECGSPERHLHPHLNTGFLLKARLSKATAAHPIHLNFNLSLDVGPGYLKSNQNDRFAYQGLTVLPISYLSLSIGLGRRE